MKCATYTGPALRSLICHQSPRRSVGEPIITGSFLPMTAVLVRGLPFRHLGGELGANRSALNVMGVAPVRERKGPSAKSKDSSRFPQYEPRKLRHHRHPSLCCCPLANAQYVFPNIGCISITTTPKLRKGRECSVKQRSSRSAHRNALRRSHCRCGNEVLLSPCFSIPTARRNRTLLRP